jgi:hypothetical protein
MKGLAAGAAGAALVFALAAAVYLLGFPVYASASQYLSTSGRGGTMTGRSTLLAVNGLSALVPVLFPVVVSAGAVSLTRTRFIRPARWVAAALLTAFALLGALSIGVFYLPSAIAMWLSAVATKVHVGSFRWVLLASDYSMPATCRWCAASRASVGRRETFNPAVVAPV